MSKKKTNGKTETTGTQQAPAAQGQGPQMTADQKYLNDLLASARSNPGAISPEQKIMIEMLAEAEQKIVSGTEQANKIQQQINQLQFNLQQLNELIAAERGTARGFANALLTLKAGKTANTSAKTSEATAPQMQ